MLFYRLLLLLSSCYCLLVRLLLNSLPTDWLLGTRSLATGNWRLVLLPLSCHATAYCTGALYRLLLLATCWLLTSCCNLILGSSFISLALCQTLLYGA